ncbi:ankyrin repeat-containing domain protein, partial [Lactarius quietus]
MKDLLDPDKPHFVSWVKIYNIDRPISAVDGNFTRATPLYYSALAGFYDLAERLAGEHPQYVNAFGGQYDFPLVVALNRSHVRVAKLLLEHGGKVNVQGTRGRTPLHTLLIGNYYRGKDIRMVHFLLEHGADVNARDEDHRTPLHILFANRHFTSGGYDRVDYALAVAQLFLEHGADVNAQDKAHETPLLLVMQHETFHRVARFLLEHGADPNLKNKAGKAPFHILLESRNTGWGLDYRSADYIHILAKMLLEHGADVNVRDNFHNTPLCLAMGPKAPNFARFLLEHGADPNLQNEAGQAP